MDVNSTAGYAGYVEIPACRNLMPLIKRAREYHVYDYGGRRYLDLYLNNGRCLLGHRPDRVFGIIKNTLSRGLAAEYPGLESGRCVRHLSTFFPEYREFRFFRSYERALSVIRSVLHDETADIRDPLVHDDPGPVQLWRPFAPAPGVQPEIMVPVIPFPSCSAPVVLCFRTGRPPVSDPVPPYFPAAFSRALGALSTLGKGKGYNENFWSAFNGSELWERKGPYLVFTSPEESYPALFESLLQKGVLLPPCRPAVGIIPVSFTAGEIAPIMKAGRIRGNIHGDT